MKDTKILFITSVFTFLYMLFNIFGKILEFEICNLKGCQIANEILKISSLELYIIALIIPVIFVFLLGKYVKTKNEVYIKYYGNFYQIIIFSHTLMLLNQYFITKEICLTCLIMYFIFILGYIVFRIQMKLFTINFMPILIIISMVVVSFMFNHNVKRNTSLFNQDGYYLIQDKTCNSCKEIKESAAKNNFKLTLLNLDDTKDITNMFNVKYIPVLIKYKDNEINIYKDKSEILKIINNSIDKKINNSYLFNENFSLSNASDKGCSIDTINNKENCEIK